MEIYRLSRKGAKVAHTIKYPDTPGWRVVHFLNKHGHATREQIFDNVSGVSSSTLASLKLKKVIVEETGVDV